MSVHVRKGALLRLISTASLLGCIAMTPLAVMASTNGLPALGGEPMSVAEERALGDRMARDLFRDPDLLEDPVVEEYVQQLWDRLLGAARMRGDLADGLEQGFAWQVLLGRDRTINAFALPGGYLGLHLGLVAATSTPDELASVLAHELTHVTQRHVARQLGQQDRLSPWVVGAMVLSAAAAARNPQAGNAVLLGGQAVAQQLRLNYSRDMEREADRLGGALMEAAGYDLRGFVGLFEKLQSASRLDDDGALPYLRSHPLNTERIADVQSRVQGHRPPQAPAQLAHILVAARARALSADGVAELRVLQARAANEPTAAVTPWQRAGDLYAGALASLRLQATAEAHQMARLLADQVRDDPAGGRLVRLLQAELAMAGHDFKQAMEALRGAETPTRRPELLLRAQLAARLNDPQALALAAEQLQSWLLEHPSDAPSWRALAQVRQAQGQTLPAVRAEAEAAGARLDFTAAVDRLRAAQELSRGSRSRANAQDLVETSIIDARLRHYENAIRMQELSRPKGTAR